MCTLLPRLVIAVAAAAAAAFVVPEPAVSAQNAVENFTAFAINTNRRPSTFSVDIRIDRWSTDEQRDTLLTIVKEEIDVNRANDMLLTALQRMPSTGSIREATSLAWDLRYARQSPLPEGGRQIVLATDRPIDFWEARNRPRKFNYRFTLLELRLNKEGRGEGKMFEGARIFIDPRTNNLVIENYDLQPVRLNEIRPRT